ncbi:hypothetical protein [Rhodococcus sp. (in: high G+C Gram-positive bacteria)]|uniref:hypothetical protein n=1 Tax=Rhodococcus sp. TaxID=1831 RepID=UPI00257AD6EF|nr:hypothetical protein [Rhodococcus sp. (in: high G+C Gram-positive bacteria)]
MLDAGGFAKGALYYHFSTKGHETDPRAIRRRCGGVRSLGRRRKRHCRHRFRRRRAHRHSHHLQAGMELVRRHRRSGSCHCDSRRRRRSHHPHQRYGAQRT